MIHVSIGSRSKSPFRPLSLRMMSLADLSRAPRDWAVVGVKVDLGISQKIMLPSGPVCALFWPEALWGVSPALPLFFILVSRPAHASVSNRPRRKCRKAVSPRSEEHTSELQSLRHLV